jgi:hypothetical protein
VNTRNPLDLELALEWFVNKDFDLFAEVTYQGTSLGSSGSTPSADNADAAASPTGVTPGSESNLTPEVGGKVIVGTAGIRYHVTKSFDMFGSFSFDNSDDKLVRFGMSVKF